MIKTHQIPSLLVNLHVFICVYMWVLSCTVIHAPVNLHMHAFYCLQEGREYLLKSVGSWLPVQKQSAASSSTDKDMQVSWSCAWYFSDGNQPSQGPSLFIKRFQLTGLSQCALQ